MWLRVRPPLCASLRRYGPLIREVHMTVRNRSVLRRFDCGLVWSCLRDQCHCRSHVHIRRDGGGAYAPTILVGTLNRQCPLWVKSGHPVQETQCPLYPQKRTSPKTVVMSALCQSGHGALRRQCRVCSSPERHQAVAIVEYVYIGHAHALAATPHTTHDG